MIVATREGVYGTNNLIFFIVLIVAVLIGFIVYNYLQYKAEVSDQKRKIAEAEASSKARIAEAQAKETQSLND